MTIDQILSAVSDHKGRPYLYVENGVVQGIRTGSLPSPIRSQIRAQHDAIVEAFRRSESPYVLEHRLYRAVDTLERMFAAEGSSDQYRKLENAFENMLFDYSRLYDEYPDKVA